jgi:hypothetical protein
MAYFPSINMATNETLSYFKIGRIKEQIRKLKGEPNLSYLDSYEEMAIQSHELMEAEINQHIHGSTENLQSQMFEHLREALGIIDSWTDNDVEILIDQYNINTEKQFNADIENKANAFKESTEFIQRKHKEEWEEEISNYGLLSSMGIAFSKVRKVHYKWYIVTGGPDVIDLGYTGDYLKFLHRIADNYKRIAGNNLKLWDEKKIKSNTTTTIIAHQPLLQPISETESRRKKLKTQLTAGQILYLFKSLNSAGIFENITIADICRFISENMSTKGKEELSAENLAKVWSKIDINDIAFWYEKFPELNNMAIKNNPLRLKYKKLSNN